MSENAHGTTGDHLPTANFGESVTFNVATKRPLYALVTVVTDQAFKKISSTAGGGRAGYMWRTVPPIASVVSQTKTATPLLLFASID